MFQGQCPGLQLEKRVAATAPISESGLRFGGDAFQHCIAIENALCVLHARSKQALADCENAPVILEVDVVGELMNKEQPQVTRCIQTDERFRRRGEVEDDVRGRGRGVSVGGIDPTPDHHPDLPRRGFQEERDVTIDIFREGKKLPDCVLVSLLIDKDEMSCADLGPPGETGLCRVRARPAHWRGAPQEPNREDKDPCPDAENHRAVPVRP